MKAPVVKKVAAIHDLSGLGRASLTAVIPTLSTMGVQVCPLPTAVLSNNTGGFDTYSFLDLTDNMQDYIAHWKRLGMEFDCIYSGFLGSPAQAEIVAAFIDDFRREESLVVVDPVMGDDGRLYSSMTQEMVAEMRALVGKADLITPNFTEAALLLGEDYCTHIDTDTLKAWLRRLSDMGPETVIITSVPDSRNPENTCVAAYDRVSGACWKLACRYIPAAYPGTGDTFTSVVIGSLLQGDSLPVALDRAVQFISQCIKASYGHPYPKREGVLLERELGLLNMPVMVHDYEIL